MGEAMEEKKTSKKMLVGIGAAAAVIAVVAVVILAARETPEQKVARLLDLGNQYLLDLDYEQAIASYDEVLSIEPQNEQAVEGEVNAYLAWSEALVAEGDFDRAAEVLQTGYEKLGDERLKTALPGLDDRRAAYEAEAALADIKTELDEFAVQAAAFCAAEDYEGASRLLADNSDLLAKLEAAGTDRYICKETEGNPVGVYVIDGKHYLYYGDYNGEMREGNGVWINEYNDESEYNSPFTTSTGEWKNDLPNGHQRVVEEPSAIKVENNYVYLSRIEGNVVDGLWDGEIVSEYKGGVHGSGDEWFSSFSKGNVTVIKEDRALSPDMPFVTAQNASGNNYLWNDQVYLDSSHGIIGFAESTQ